MLMLTAIAQLGKVSGESSVEVLVDSADTKDVLMMEMQVNKKGMVYKRLSLEENKGEHFYLYKRELGGAPGKFITGRINALAVKELKKAISKNNPDKETISTFKKNKVCWVSKSRAVNEDRFLVLLPEDSRKILNGIVREIINKQDQIMKDICHKVRTSELGAVLLTVKLIRNSTSYYLKDIQGFVDLFKVIVANPRDVDSSNKKTIQEIKCTICNNDAENNVFPVPPLPFYTIDKQNFIPNAAKSDGFKVFPLCKNCFIDLQGGKAFIENNLVFNIPGTGEGRAVVHFWLVPVLNNQQLAQLFLRNFKRGDLYSLKKLRVLCERIEVSQQMELSAIRTTDESDAGKLESFMNFSALFFTEDQQKHMRVLGSAEGIYPARLKEIYQAKEEVDKLYKTKSEERIFFSFVLLRDFIEKEKTEGWMSCMAHFLANIFLNKGIDSSFLYSLLLREIQSTNINKNGFEKFKTTCLKALVIIEYLVRVGLIMTSNEAFQGKPYETNDPTVREIKNFLDSHYKFLSNGTLRAICSIGVSVGILLEVQKRKMKSMPFMNRLNRLEMDINRINSLFTQVKMKLYYYKINDYDTLLSYLGAAEIANLDISEMIPKNLLNLVFAVGMSEGYIIAHNLVEMEVER